MLNIAYFGSPLFSSEFLQALIKQCRNLSINLVITQEPKPIGRKKILTPTPVEKIAQSKNIKVMYYGELQNNPDILRKAEFALVFAYGKIIPASLLKLPKYGFINLHLSLLPRYRGSSPVAYSLLMGDKTTGLTFTRMDKFLDHGNILMTKKANVLLDDTRETLINRLTKESENVFCQFIKKEIFRDTGAPQNHSQATYTKLLNREDGFINIELLRSAINNKKIEDNTLPKLIQSYLNRNPSEQQRFFSNVKTMSSVVFNLFRGLSPWPGIWTEIKIRGQIKRLKLLDLHIENNNLIIKKVQLEGKNPVDYTTFINAYGEI